MNTLYSTKVTATGGRHGQIRSEDGLLEMKLALPRQLGGKGDATNPETLFAGGYAPASRTRSYTHLLQLTEFSFKTIKYWSGFADDCRSKTLKCSANMRIKEF
jgi:hypothetical protein